MHLKVIIDFDGTLTAEETQVAALASKSLDTLAGEILHTSRQELAGDYQLTRTRLLDAPHRYWWEVNGLVASYCDEGAFILNTTTLQVMLRENPLYAETVAAAFPQAKYDPVVDCSNYLFHRHTAELSPRFRPSARRVLTSLDRHPQRTPLVLTNSLGDKVRKHLSTLALDFNVLVLGDTRQYEMDPAWQYRFHDPALEGTCIWRVDEVHSIDLRRPAYYQALMREAADGSRLAIIADTFSLPGALPLQLGLPFFLLRTSYTPAWCAQAVATHPLGTVLDDIAQLPMALDETQES